MSLLTRPPHPHLATYIERYGSLRLDARARVAQFPDGNLTFPDTRIRIAFHFSDQTPWMELNDGRRASQPSFNVRGYQLQAFRFNTDAAINVLSVEFTPFGFYGLFGIPPSAFGLTSENLEAVLQNDYSYLLDCLSETSSFARRTALLDAFFLRKTDRHEETLRACEIYRLIRQGDTPLSVHQLADRACMSERTLHRFFAKHFGIQPKLFLRLQRFERTLASLKTGAAPSLVDLALNMGYYDQAHFNNEMKYFTEMTPSELKQFF